MISAAALLPRGLLRLSHPRRPVEIPPKSEHSGVFQPGSSHQIVYGALNEDFILVGVQVSDFPELSICG